MTLNQWQTSFLRRLVELGGAISVPEGVLNEELLELIKVDYVREGRAQPSQVCYEITEAGRAALSE